MRFTNYSVVLCAQKLFVGLLLAPLGISLLEWSVMERCFNYQHDLCDCKTLFFLLFCKKPPQLIFVGCSGVAVFVFFFVYFALSAQCAIIDTVDNHRSHLLSSHPSIYLIVLHDVTPLSYICIKNQSFSIILLLY